MSISRVPRRSLNLVVVLFVLLGSSLSASAVNSPLSHQARSVSAQEVRTIRQFDISTPTIALTFDAGADRGYAEDILNTLSQYGIRSSFGITGVWAEQNPDLIQCMARGGHHLMNHSWDHPSFVDINSEELEEQLESADEVVTELTGKPLRPFFRPPFGEYNDFVLQELARNGYFYNILWTVDSLGWNGYTRDQIIARITEGAAPGAIMLMHVGAQSQDAFALESIIQSLRSQGYSFATVEEIAGSSLPDPSRYFPETGYSVNSTFYSYWLANGGLSIFGYPISAERNENGLPVQYFERARFELHSEYAGTNYEVLLGLLGTDVAASSRRATPTPFLPVDAGDNVNCAFFDATGHRLCFGFRDYWLANGGLPIFGYPISEEFQERNPDDGRYYTVQYFERARFEWHPELVGTPYEVLLGRLGAQVLSTASQ